MSSSTETTLAGRQHRDPVGDLGWVREHSNGNRTIDLFCFVLRKVFRQCVNLVTFDKPSFEHAMAEVQARTGGDVPLVVIPVHRSYFDFLFCSYLFHAHPELGIKVPKIAAAEEFGQVPVLGHLLNRCGAFYIRRGVGKEDMQLTEQVHELVAERSVFEFFIEGKRSRAREYLPPKRGMLKCLQGTDETFAILPISISYDRLPEERALHEELLGGPKPRMTLRAMSGWAVRLLRGQLRLGRIHITCGEPQWLSPDTDVPDLAAAIMKQLQLNTALTDFHVEVFAKNNAIDPDWLRQALQTKGARILSSSLAPADGVLQDQQLQQTTERALRYQWLHWFADDMRAAAQDNLALTHWLDRQCYTSPGKASNASDPQFQRLLQALFERVCVDYQRLGVALKSQPASTDVDVEAMIQSVMTRHRDADLHVLRCAVEALKAADLLIPVETKTSQNWRRCQRLSDIDAWVASCAWPLEAQADSRALNKAVNA